MNLVVIMPCLDDARTASELAVEVHQHATEQGHAVSFLFMDDGSERSLVDSLREMLPSAPFPMAVLRLRKNVGHQRAIACGLCHLVEHQVPADAIVVMDSDGEDLPKDVLALAAPLSGKADAVGVVFAKRARRSETFAFRIGYRFYLAAHRVLVGHAPRVGNFSAITVPAARSLVADSNLWSHYAATIWTSRLTRTLIPVHRGKRRRGSSKLGYTSLVLHGLAAISCYRETLAVRMLLGSGLVLALTLAVFVVTVYSGVRLRTPDSSLAILGSGLGVFMMMHLCILSLWQCLNTLQKRHQATFMPMRDYSLFVAERFDLGTPFPAAATTNAPRIFSSACANTTL